MSDHKGARLVLGALPPASHLIADRGYDRAWFREELEARDIKPCVPSSRSRKVSYAYDTTLYRHRHKIETCSPSSRTGGVSPPATTDLPTHFFRPSASQPMSSSGSDQ